MDGLDVSSSPVDHTMNTIDINTVQGTATIIHPSVCGILEQSHGFQCDLALLGCFFLELLHIFVSAFSRNKVLYN